MEGGWEEVAEISSAGSDGRDGGLAGIDDVRFSAPGDSVASEDGGLSFCKSEIKGLSEIDLVVDDVDSLRISCSKPSESRSVAVEESRDSNSVPFEEALDADDLFHAGIYDLDASNGERDRERGDVDLNENEIKGSGSKTDSEDGERRRWKCLVSNDVLDSIQSLKEILLCITEKIGGDRRLESISEVESTLVEDEMELLLLETKQAHKLGLNLMSVFTKHEDASKREKKGLEIRIVSLTEENEDIGNLLRIALLEKEAAVKETNLDRLKGNSTNQKRMAILQYAEIGLQKVGFGFVLGSSTDDLPFDDQSSSDGDGPESENESSSLISTVENIMKKLRLEITELRRSLNESRLDSECLQSLTDRQAQTMSENNCNVKNLEEREILLNRKIYDLTLEIKEAEEEGSRWKEACELEVEAVKIFMEENERKVAILQKEYEWTKTSLDCANKKLILKEKLATTAMAAQAAAETSLRIADSRSTVLRKQIEELTKQSEVAECGGQHRIRHHVCWPWPKLLPSTSHSRRIPEMLPLLQ